MKTTIAISYWIGFAALTCGTIPAGEWLHDQGVSFYLIAFIWFMFASGFSWSLSRWMIAGRHW